MTKDIGRSVDGSIAWLLEWPANKFQPTRYYAADEHQPVLDPNLATRFCRKQDAMAVGKALNLAPSDNLSDRCRAVEHVWLTRESERTGA